MKRFSRRAVVEGLQEHKLVLRYNFWFTLHAGWKVEDRNGNILGYVTDTDAWYIRNSFEAGELTNVKGFNDERYYCAE